MTPERRREARAYAKHYSNSFHLQRYLTEALDELDRLERELAAAAQERDELIASGAIAGTVRMGPDEDEQPVRARRRR